MPGEASGCFAARSFTRFWAMYFGKCFKAVVGLKQPNSRPQKVAKLTLDVFDYLGSEGNTVFREQGVEFGCGYDHSGYVRIGG